MWNKAFLALGSNLGDSVDLLKQAVLQLEAFEDIRVCEKSSFYATAPWGYTDQPDFVNAVIQIETQLHPEVLLEKCQMIEANLNRVRLVHWGPRTIDVDILLYDSIEMATEKLTIPHPRMTERAFVMVPLLEIAPTLVLAGQSVKAICEGLVDQEIRKMINEEW